MTTNKLSVGVLLLAFSAILPTIKISAETPRDDRRGKETERSLVAALYWLAHHQSPNGSWNLKEYQNQCKDDSCTGPASEPSLAMATSLGLLSLLCADQSQTREGPFRDNVQRSVDWLTKQQKSDGDLSGGSEQQMLAHGLAAWALCEDYRLSHDKQIGEAAQKAIQFIEAAQDKKTGGWGDHPRDEADMGIVGWQMLALHTAKVAKLKVDQATFDRTQKWIESVSHPGANGEPGLFSRVPGEGPTPTMTAIGMVCEQCLKMKPLDPIMLDGAALLMTNPPDDKNRDARYWFFGTLAMHGLGTRDWDTWNRRIRKHLVPSQETEKCATGSWDSDKIPHGT